MVYYTRNLWSLTVSSCRLFIWFSVYSRRTDGGTELVEMCETQLISITEMNDKSNITNYIGQIVLELDSAIDHLRIVP